MHKRFRFFVLAASMLTLNLLFFHPVFASSNGIIETNFWGAIQDNGTGCGIYLVLNLILDILTFGAAIAAVIGITISGITYLTAKDNEQQTTKAKRRIFEVIIGLVAYAVLFAALNFLLPGGKLNPSSECKRISEEELATIRKKEKEQKNNYSNSNGNNSNPSNNPASPKTNNKKKKGESSELGKKILKEMEKTANKFVNIGVTFDNDHCSSSWGELYKKKKSCCSSYIFLTLKRMGLLSKSGDAYFHFKDYGKTLVYGNKSKSKSVKKELRKNFVEIKGNDTIKNLVKKGKLVPGDICGDGQNAAHTIMYAGKASGGKYKIHSYGGGKFSKKKHYNVKVSGSYKIGKILHAK